MNMADERVQLYKEFLGEVYSYVKALGPLPENGQRLIACVLLGRTIELGTEIRCVLGEPDSTSAFVLLRRIIETSVDLENLCKDAGYLETIEANWLAQRQRVLVMAEGRGSTHRYLDSLAANSSLDQQLRETSEPLELLKPKALSLKKRFKKANLTELFEGPYAYLYWHTHRNLNILIDRFLSESEEKVNVQIGGGLGADDYRLILLCQIPRIRIRRCTVSGPLISVGGLGS